MAAGTELTPVRKGTVAGLANGLRAFLAAAAGIGLYFLGDRESWWWVVAIVFVGIVIGSICRAGGRRVLSRHPVMGVWLLNFWTIALIAIGAAITCTLTLVAVTVGHEIAKLDKAEADQIGPAIVAVLSSLAGAAFLTDLQEGTGSLSVAAITQKAFEVTFLDCFKSGSRSFDAVFEDRLEGSPKIKGWGLLARMRRARVISSSPRDASPSPPAAIARNETSADAAVAREKNK